MSMRETDQIKKDFSFNQISNTSILVSTESTSYSSRVIITDAYATTRAILPTALSPSRYPKPDA